ncbi:ATP synthase F1 subunit delta [bacterium]|jgi:F-type H+-transporting ATPase subunit delta|nr:ATP synthase F1 subunit delta [bacterium]
MKNRILAERYINALINSIPEAKVTTDLPIASQVIKDVLENKAEYNKMVSPFIHKHNKKIRMAALVKKNGASQTVESFFYLIITKNRIGLLSDFGEMILEKIKEMKNEVAVLIETATVLDTSGSTSLIATLETKTNKKLNPTYLVNTDILGGFKATIKNTIYDGSVQHSIEKVRQKFNHR